MNIIDVEEWIEVEAQEDEHVHLLRDRGDGFLECTSDGCKFVVEKDAYL